MQEKLEKAGIPSKVILDSAVGYSMWTGSNVYTVTCVWWLFDTVTTIYTSTVHSMFGPGRQAVLV